MNVDKKNEARAPVLLAWPQTVGSLCVRRTLCFCPVSETIFEADHHLLNAELQDARVHGRVVHEGRPPPLYTRRPLPSPPSPPSPPHATPYSIT